jgi:hypothetical protein
MADEDRFTTILTLQSNLSKKGSLRAVIAQDAVRVDPDFWAGVLSAAMIQAARAIAHVGKLDAAKVLPQLQAQTNLRIQKQLAMTPTEDVMAVTAPRKKLN